MQSRHSNAIEKKKQQRNIWKTGGEVCAWKMIAGLVKHAVKMRFAIEKVVQIVERLELTIGCAALIAHHKFLI